MELKGKKIGIAFCGSFCTFDKVFHELEHLKETGAEIYPVFSDAAKGIESRFGKPADFIKKAEEIVGRWLSGKLVVLELTGRLISESGGTEKERSLKLFGTLIASGKLKSVGYEKSGDEAKDVASYAASHRFAVITGTNEEAKLYEGRAKVLCLENL